MGLLVADPAHAVRAVIQRHTIGIAAAGFLRQANGTRWAWWVATFFRGFAAVVATDARDGAGHGRYWEPGRSRGPLRLGPAEIDRGSRGDAAETEQSLEQGTAPRAAGKGLGEPVEGSIVHW